MPESCLPALEECSPMISAPGAPPGPTLRIELILIAQRPAVCLNMHQLATTDSDYIKSDFMQPGRIQPQSSVKNECRLFHGVKDSLEI